MVDFFEYNDIASFEFGLIVTGLRTYGAPNRRVETVHIRGRNGDLLIDEGTFDNIIVSYDIAVVQDFPVNARAIAQWLLADGGYHTLRDSYNPDYFREATYFNAIDFDVESLKHQGKGTINFYAMPQRYDEVGNAQVEIGSGTLTFTNPYGFTAKPLIKMRGTGTITVGDLSITVHEVANVEMTIDCETMQCYEGNTNCNLMVTMTDFPVIPPYETVTFTITARNGVETAIDPRYWRL